MVAIKIVKWCVYVLVILFLLIAASLAFVLMAPSRAVALVEFATGYKVTALDINTSTSALSADGLWVRAPDGRDLLRADEFHSGIDALGAWRGTAPFWDIRIRNADVYLTASSEQPGPATQPAAALDFARILGARSVDIDSLTVHAGESQTQYSLALQRVDDNTLTMQATVGDELAVNGTLKYQLDARTQLTFQLPELDLRALLTASSSPSSGEDAVGASEAVMDWSWLGMLRNTDLSVGLAKLLLPAQTLNDANATLTFAENGVGLELKLGSLRSTSDADISIQDLVMQADLTTLARNTQQQDLKGRVTLKSEGVEFSAEGEFNVNGANGNALALALSLAPQSSLAVVLPSAVAPYLPARLQTDLLIDAGNYQIGDLQATFAESDLAGSLSFALLNDAPVLQARLRSKTLVLLNANEDDSAEPQGAEDEDASTGNKDKIFNEEPLDWSWLEYGSVDVELEAEVLRLYEARFSDFTLMLKGEQGNLTVKPLSATFGGGGFSGSASIEKIESGAASKVTFEMSGVDLEAFGVVPQQQQLAGGKTSLELDLNTKGNTSAEMASALHGTMHLLVHDAVVQNDSFELIGSDILLETLNKLNPFAKTDPTTKLHCALVHFDISDGQMKTDKALVVETEKMEIIGDGSINLADETLDILVTPNAKQTVGLNVGSVVKFMKLGGTLANPSPAVDAGGLLKSGASIGAAMSTGGVSLLAENLVKKVSEQNACRKSLLAAGAGK